MGDTRAIFARYGIRCTKQRLILFEAMSLPGRHPTAEELHERVKSHFNGLSLATVYNTLETFCRCGLCQKLPTSCSGARYDANLRQHLHITSTDGGIHDVPEALGDELLNSLPRSTLSEIEQRTGIKIRRVTIEIMGDPIESDNHAAISGNHRGR